MLKPISDANIEVDMIVLATSRSGSTDLSFTVHRDDYSQALRLVQKAARAHSGCFVAGQRSRGEAVDGRRRHALARRSRHATLRVACDAGARDASRFDLRDQDLRAGSGSEARNLCGDVHKAFELDKVTRPTRGGPLNVC